jgi:hypothetical protein
MNIKSIMNIKLNILKYAVMTLAFAGLVASVGSVSLQAHKGHDHMLKGTLTSVAADKVVVKVVDEKTKQESEKTVAITPTTKVLKGMPGTAAKASDLTTGSKVVVNIGEGKEPLSAKEIHIAAAPAAHGTH